MRLGTAIDIYINLHINMEENKEVKKLSYEQLEEAAKQISQQAEAVFRENKQLKQALQQASLANLYKELELKFKVLKYEEMFTSDFVQMCINSIQEVMTPVEEESNGDKEEG